MDVGKSFTYMFEDKEWITKIIIGGLFVLLSAIVIGIPFVLGYSLEIVRRVVRRDPELLPEWNNLGEKFVQGLLLMVIIIIWMIPVWLLACAQGVFSAALGQASNTEGVLAVLSVCLGCIEFLWGIVVALASPALYTRFAMTGQFASAFQFAEIWDFAKKNITNVIIAVLLAAVAGLLGSFGVILCVVGVLVTYFWSYLVTSHLYGLVYRHAYPEAMPPAAPEPPMPPAPGVA
jgi:hypothetical protein